MSTASSHGVALRLLAVNLPSEPLFSKVAPARRREGYEVDVAEAIASELGRRVEWVFKTWSNMIPALQAGEADAILCGQGITEERSQLVDFTRPYAVFDEAVLIRRGESIAAPADLAGKRVLAIAGSTNLKLAESFSGANVIPFEATGEDVLADLVAELRSGNVDAVVDDEVVLHPICREGEFEVAFSSPTANRWALAVAKGRTEISRDLDEALALAIATGVVERAWRHWMPEITFPKESLG